jgi:uncharacterized NAD(P)/FAD-binding protein YdhS
VIPGSLEAGNIVILNSKLDHEYMARELKQGVKRVSIIGANLESLEIVSTLRREYPKLHITVIDENRESILEAQFGKEVANSLIQ